MSQAEIGIIGGSGLYSMPGFTNVREEHVDTPFGEPSDAFVLGELEGRKVAFLARHGRGHRILPSELNFRANIYAMKSLGVERILSVSAVGSLKEEHKPTDFVIPDQFIDRTFNRVAKECGDTIEGAIDKLIGNHKIRGLVLLFERADSRDRKNALDAQRLHRIDVGAEVQLRGQDAVAPPVSRQKSHLAPLQFAQHKSVRRLAKGRIHALFAHVRKSRHRVQPAAADDANLRLRQNLLPPDPLNSANCDRLATTPVANISV